jgi:hypothetical protein
MHRQAQFATPKVGMVSFARARIPHRVFKVNDSSKTGREAMKCVFLPITLVDGLDGSRRRSALHEEPITVATPVFAGRKARAILN